MSALIYSISRIWARDEPITDSETSSQQVVPSTSESVENTGARRPRTPNSAFESKLNDLASSSDISIRRRRVTLNPCTTSASSPSCLIPGGFPKSALSSRGRTISGNLEFPFVGFNRCARVKPKRIMWEDSGYESPNQKKESQTIEKDQTLSPSPGPKDATADSSNCYDDNKGVFREHDVNDNTCKSHHSDICFGEKFSAHSPTKYSYIPPSVLNYRYQPRRRQTSDLDKSLGSLNDISLAGMSPVYTSTPIKSATTPNFDGLRFSNDVPPYPPSTSAELFSYNSPSQQQLTCAEGPNLSLSNCSLTKEMVDESVAKIVQEGSDEFRGKYSQWIAQVFHFQVDKMQRRLSAQFDRNLETVVREKEREIISIQQKYRNKLIEFEASTAKASKWIENLAEENQRVRETKDAIIAEMQKTAADQKENFRLELEKQINNVQAECEKEKLALQRKHADQLKNINEKSMGQVTRLEEQFGKQVESLQALIGELKSQNVTMEEQLSYFKKSSDQQHSALHNKYVNYHKEREQLLSAINDLREKLSQSEKEKSTIVSTHNEEIFNIQRDAERINQNATTRMINSQSIVEGLQRKHEEEVTYLKKQMALQESQYRQGIADLRNTYGQRISHLTKTVEGLQLELMGGRTKTSNLV